jgi:hypothetical protein
MAPPRWGARDDHGAVSGGGRHITAWSTISCITARLCRSRPGYAGVRLRPPGQSNRPGRLSSVPSPALASGDEPDGRWRRKGPSGWVSAGRRRKQRTQIQKCRRKASTVQHQRPDLRLTYGLVADHTVRIDLTLKAVRSTASRRVRSIGAVDVNSSYGTLPRIEAGWPGNFRTLPVSTTLSP